MTEGLQGVILLPIDGAPAAGPVDIEFRDGLIASIAPASQAPRAAASRCPRSPTRTITRARSRRPRSAPRASRWRPGCCACPRCPRSIPISAPLAAFARAARAGAGSVMAHYTRLHGPMSYVDEMREVARAANDVGVRVTLALFMRDRNPLVYGDAGKVLDGPRSRVPRGGGGRVSDADAEPRGADRAGRSRRGGGREPDVQRAVWTQRRAMVLGRTAWRDRRCLSANGTARSHASPRDALSARLRGCGLSRGRRCAARRARAAFAEADARPLRLCARQRTST